MIKHCGHSYDIYSEKLVTSTLIITISLQEIDLEELQKGEMKMQSVLEVFSETCG